MIPKGPTTHQELADLYRRKILNKEHTFIFAAWIQYVDTMDPIFLEVIANLDDDILPVFGEWVIEKYLEHVSLTTRENLHTWARTVDACMNHIGQINTRHEELLMQYRVNLKILGFDK